ncbi:unnamed protein product [Calicophoron daubneyi]
MVNQVYLLPKSGLPTPPSVMQVRSLATGQSVTQPNGLVTGAQILPRSNFSQPPVTGNPGATKLVGFLNQLLELSKNVAADTHNAVVRLIQALVNAELDSQSFCTQLRTNLKSANTSMDIGPFIKDNIEALRRDLANGLCRLPNIHPPSGTLGAKDLITSTSTLSTTGVTCSPAVTVQIRPSVGVCMPAASQVVGPRLSVPSVTQPRIVSALMSNTVTGPTTCASSTASLTSATRFQQVSQPPLLAPAPPRSSLVSTNLTTNQLAVSNVGSLPKYRLAQPVSAVVAPSSVATILPATAAATVLSTRLTPASNAVRTNYTNLRPVLAPSPVSASGTMYVQAVKAGAGAPSLVRTKFTLPPSSASSSTIGCRTATQLLSSTSSSLVADGANGTDDSRVRPSSPTKDRPFFPPEEVKAVLANQGNISLADDAVICLAHGLQAFARSLLTRLSIVVTHRLERLGDDPRLTQADCARDQLRFLQKLDEHDKMRQSELEKDLILKAAKSRSRNEDPDQIRMREMARRIASEDYEREKQHQANLTALHAIGPQRKRRFDNLDESGNLLFADSTTNSYASRDVLLTHNRLSLVGGSRLSILNSNSSPFLPQSGSESGQTATLLPLPGGGTSRTLNSSATDNSSSFSLSHAPRIHRATLKDVQLVLSRTPRLRQTRTYYQTHWHS